VIGMAPFTLSVLFPNFAMKPDTPVLISNDFVIPVRVCEWGSL
jgi:hypothetical protein